MKIFDASDYIVVKLSEGGTNLNILKLHKLLYYVQSWGLALGEGRTFDGKFQAWVHGPVNRDVYDRYIDTKSMYSPVGLSDINPDFDPLSLPDKKRAVIDSVLEVYADYTGDQLEEMTHREDPWINARNGLSPAARSNASICESDMERFYKARLG